jgi:branched-chain amino acid transport system ATP-binding protein
MLKIEHLNSGYGEIQVLWDISLEVREGEVVALIGSNGAGKSTLLWTISGLLKPSTAATLLAISSFSVKGAIAHKVGI